MDRDADYDILPFPPARKVIVDAGRLASRRHIAHGLLEVDVTAARDFMRGAKARGKDLSFTAFLVACFARAIAANPTVQAYRDGRGRLIVFHDVDVATPIEASADTAAIPHIVRAANRKTVTDISAEIRSIQVGPAASQQTGGLVALGERAPRLAYPCTPHLADALERAGRDNAGWRTPSPCLPACVS